MALLLLVGAAAGTPAPGPGALAAANAYQAGNAPVDSEHVSFWSGRARSGLFGCAAAILEPLIAPRVET